MFLCSKQLIIFIIFIGLLTEYIYCGATRLKNTPPGNSAKCIRPAGRISVDKPG
jgi:hypothetical protein